MFMNIEKLNCFVFESFEKDDVINRMHYILDEDKDLDIVLVNKDVLELVVAELLKDFIPELKDFDYWFDGLGLYMDENNIYGTILSSEPYKFFQICVDGRKR